MWKNRIADHYFLRHFHGIRQAQRNVSNVYERGGLSYSSTLGYRGLNAGSQKAGAQKYCYILPIGTLNTKSI